MLFNSYEFLFVFFPLVVLVFFALSARMQALATAWLGLASLGFYAWWSMQALPLLLGSILFNYHAGRLLVPREATARPKPLLALAVSVNLGFLALFKYADFFIANVNTGLAATGHAPMGLLHLTLPIGISFYTFTQIAFLVDCWQGKVREARFAHYLLFVTYFPHLVAGPVLHHAQMMPQFANPATFRLQPSKVVTGLALLSIGLTKKLWLADPLGLGADAIFGAAAAGHTPGAAASWVGTLAYALQIYFDFSGYSDMAIGLSLVMGVRLPANFDSPYKASSIIDFWRRWHISLSTFLRDYLYIPLGGNRFGPTRRYLNLATTMVLGGLWHGASWTFVLWGAFHGACLTLAHLWQSHRHTRSDPHDRCIGPLQRLTGWALTFFAVCMAWVLFRSPDLATAGRMYAGLFGAGGFDPRPFSGVYIDFAQARFYQTLLLGLLLATCCPNSAALARHAPRLFERRGTAAVLGSATVFSLLFAASLSKLGSHSAFLYFQF